MSVWIATGVILIGCGGISGVISHFQKRFLRHLREIPGVAPMQIATAATDLKIARGMTIALPVIGVLFLLGAAAVYFCR